MPGCSSRWGYRSRRTPQGTASEGELRSACLARPTAPRTPDESVAARQECSFFAASVTSGASAWAAYAAPSASTHDGSGFDPEALRREMAPSYSSPGFHLPWYPAEVKQHGGFEVVTGTFTVTAPDANGSPKTQNGRYLTLWVRQPDGSFRFAWDGSN